jgi:hypothetical protein
VPSIIVLRLLTRPPFRLDAAVCPLIFARPSDLPSADSGPIVVLPLFLRSDLTSEG